MGTINSVTGPIRTENLGVTLSHEHLLVDTSCWYLKPSNKALSYIADAPIRIQNLGLLRRAGQFSRVNQILSNVALACKELALFGEAGGSTIFDCTSIGLSRNTTSLAKISKKTGVKIIAGTGFYIDASHPPRVKAAKIEELRDEIVSDLENRMDETTIRAGFIGEIGVSPGKMTKNEQKVLRAAAKAQALTKVPLTVHYWEPWIPEEKRTAL